ncbi:MAG TPA: alpha/beta hydrolase [Hyphomicrobiaceae bacterium]|nr:alpha/beta hydrolase [Hyphomicrobiaceae bacterium]
MTVLDHTREGRGRPTIVFVHGFGCARSDWRAQVAHLRDRFETVAVDLGGHGTTQGSEAHEIIDTHGRDVAALLAELAIDCAVLVGHSMGCRIVMHAMSEAPDRVAGIILVDGSRLGAAGSTAYRDRQKRVAEIGYRAFIEPMFAQMFLPGADRAVAQPIIDRARNMPAKLAGNLFPNIGKWDAERFDEIFAKARVPVMAIQTTYMTPEGRRASMQKGQTSAYLDDVRRLVPGARVEIIENAGHFPQIEQAGEVNTLIDDFMAKLKS